MRSSVSLSWSRGQKLPARLFSRGHHFLVTSCSPLDIYKQKYRFLVESDSSQEFELSSQSETELLAAAKQGDVQAFDRVLRPHLPMLLAYCRAICADFHVAEDAVQETALIAFRKLEHLFPEVDFATWLRGIAKRQALASRRKATPLPSAAEEVLELAYANVAPEELGPEQEALAHCLRQLGGRAGELVRHHYYDGMPLGQVGQVLDMTLSAVKVALFRARMQLKDCVQQRLRAESVP